MKQKILKSFFIFACSLFVLFAMNNTDSTFTAEAVVHSGTADNISWTFDTQTGILNVNGTGDMGDYSYTMAPWMAHSYDVTQAYIADGITSVGSFAFAGCFSMTKLHIPDSVTKIDDSAFANCVEITQITLPEKLESIGMTSFSSCMKLQTITFPSTLTSIGECAFQFCEALTSVVIPATVTEIGTDAFRSCTALTDVTLPVWAINKNNIFRDCTAIEKVTITAGGTMPEFTTNSSDTSAVYYQHTPWYQGGENFKTLVVEDGIERIGAYAFYGISSLESVTLADTVTQIGNYAFYNCSSLQSLTMRVDTVFDKTSFENCKSLVSLHLLKGSGIMPSYKRDDNAIYYYNTPWYQSADTFTTLVLEDGISNISKYAFYGCSKLANVTLPADLEVIDEYAFSYSDIINLTIPDTVTAIRDYAFASCMNIKSLTMPASAAVFESLYTFDKCFSIEAVTLTAGNGTMPDYTATDYEYSPWYKSRNSVTSLTLCDGIQHIGAHAFRGLTKLTSVTVPETVKTIGEYAFYSVKALTEINIPALVTEIPSCAFAYCTALNNLTVPETVTAIADHAYIGCSGLTDLVIGSKVETIGEHAFNKCTALKNVTIGKSVRSMGDSAFYECTALEKVNITDIAAYCEIDFASDKTNPAYYSQKLYLNDELITDLVIPDTVETVKTNTFNTIDHIETITVSPNTQKFDTYFFRTDIKGVYISDLAAWCTVEFNSFDLNDSPLYLNGIEIKELVIPDGVTEIKAGTFSKGTFTSVVIPDSVQTVREDAFTACLSLKELTVPITALEDSSFYGCENLEYITLTGGSDGKMPTGITSYPWDDCDNLKKVTFAEGVTYVGTRSFEGCELTEIVFPSTMKEIGQYAFYGSKNIRSIDFGGCEEIGKNAFYNCHSLQRVIFGKNLTTVQPSAFSGCPATVTYYEGTESKAGDIYFSTFNKAVDANAHWVYNYSRTAHKFDGEVLFNKNMTMLICYPHYLTDRFYAVPDTVRSIEQNAVLSSSLLAVSLPEGLKNIGSEAFLSCSNLSAVYIPAGIVSIDEYAFGNNEKLNDIYFGGSEEQWNNIQVGEDNDSLKKATLHYNCAPFVVENNAVYTADKTALLAWLDPQAQAVHIPDGVTYIGKNAFSNCNAATVTFGKDVKTIGTNAFYGCKELTSITLPDSVTELGNLAFYDCAKLADITLSDNLVTIGNDCFGDCITLKRIVLPAKVKTVGDRAFYDCTALESVDFPAGLQSIGTAAFCNCTALTEVSVPAGVTAIGTAVFENCTSLTSFCLPSGIAKVPDNLLYGCAKLEKVYIPACVTEFGDSAFYNCSALSDIYFSGSEEAWNAISVTSSNSILYAVNVHYDHSHAYGEWVEDETQITKSRFCADCNAQEKAFIDGFCVHEWNEGEITIPPTIDAEGEKTFTCTVCGTTRSESIEKLEPETIHYGDVDGNGQITSADARLALRASVGLEALSEEAAVAADVNGDTSVTSSDARLILRFGVGLETSFPAQK